MIVGPSHENLDYEEGCRLGLAAISIFRDHFPKLDTVLTREKERCAFFSAHLSFYIWFRLNQFSDDIAILINNLTFSLVTTNLNFLGN